MTFPEKHRYNHLFVPFVKDDPAGGFFRIPHLELTNHLFGCLANNSENWEHVCVTVFIQGSRPDRCCTWDEMCFIKSHFWDDEQAVMQLHPPKSQWISNHPYCLHLWKPKQKEIPLPPSILVGAKEFN